MISVTPCTNKDKFNFVNEETSCCRGSADFAFIINFLTRRPEPLKHCIVGSERRLHIPAPLGRNDFPYLILELQVISLTG